jgi:aryl-alcohol dehydrogenase-like predicted oxidoreductase
MVPSPAKGIDRIVLGTVQLGLAYGRQASAGVPDREHCFRVLDAAWGHGIRSFDTAEAYGEAADRLSEWIAARGVAASCDVVTKVPASRAGSPDEVARAAGKFTRVGSCTVMTHGAVDANVFAGFRESAERAGALPGASVYEAGEVAAMSGFGARRIQAPINAFDTRQRDAAHRCGVPIDGRSVFLQGVLLEHPERSEARAPGTGRMARAVERASAASGIPSAVALLGWAIHGLGPRDRIVVGVDRPEELDAIVSATSLEATAIRAFADALAADVGSWVPDREALDPRTWRPR